jgi:beta-galactosidase
MWQLECEEPFLRTSVQVPFCYDFKGRVSCSKRFDLEDDATQRAFILHCDGINYQCEILINDRFIVKHEGGFTPFSTLVPEGVIKESNNTIQVRIDNRLDFAKTIPLRNNVNYPKNYGGIYRDIYLIAAPKVFVNRVNLTSEVDINFNADIRNVVTISSGDIGKISNGAEEFGLKSEIIDIGGTVKASSSELAFSVGANSTITLTNSLTISGPILWSSSEPHLYKVRTIILKGGAVIDEIETEFGINEWRFSPVNTLLINNQEVFLKGVNYVEEFSGKGICGSYEDIERDIALIRGLGCNAIKTYGRPASPYLLQVCSREGVYVFEELPIFDVPADIMEGENYVPLAENQLSEMIRTHQNYPSVIGYGLGNDFETASEEGKNFAAGLAALAKSLDKKIVYYSTRNYTNDITRGAADITGMNFYDGSPGILKDITNDIKFKKQRSFSSNFGKNIDPANLGGYSDPNSLEAQSKYAVDAFKIIKGSSLSGCFFLTFSDWNADYPNLDNTIPANPFLRTTGLYDLERQPRPAAIILKKLYTDEDVPNLNIGTYSKEPPIFFVIVGVMLFIAFVYLTNSVRKLRENVWRAMIRPFNFFSDVREQNLIPAFHNVLIAVIIAVGCGMFAASQFYFWRRSNLFDIVLAVLIPDEDLKTLADGIIANPITLTLVLSAWTFIKIFVISVVIWLFSLTLKFRVSFNNIYTITAWGLLPYILLLIAGIFYYRILPSNPEFSIIAFILLGFLAILSLYRILKGTRIIFDSSAFKTYAYGVATVAVIGGGMWFYLDTRYFWDYLGLVMSFLKG